MAEVRWAITAGNDLQAIENFIAKDSTLHAVNFIDRLVESSERLLVSPEIGRSVPEFGRRDLREILFRGYRIVYLLRKNEAIILRVVHGARDLARLVKREPWEIE